jgi:hypothetical protein
MNKLNLKNRIRANALFLLTGCWGWLGAKKKTGYGYMTIGSRTDGTRKTTSAHRVSYMAFKGKIPLGRWVLHKCDNPWCVNPDHLYLGNRSDNVRDMMSRGRLNHVFGEKSPKSKLKEEGVKNLRKERLLHKTPYRDLAAKYGLKSHKHVIEICNGKLWKHIPLPEPPEVK